MFPKIILSCFGFVAIVFICFFKEGDSHPNNLEALKGLKFIYGVRKPNHEKFSNGFLNWAGNDRNTRHANHGLVIDSYDDDYTQHENGFERGPFNPYELGNNHGTVIDRSL